MVIQEKYIRGYESGELWKYRRNTRKDVKEVGFGNKGEILERM